MLTATGALTLTGCQGVSDDAPATAQAPTAEAAVAETPPSSGYPPLQSVPPRPRLSYTVQQQRQIVEALVADRENARYTSQVIRYRSGLSSLAPPPAPPEQVAPPLPVVEADAPAVTEPGLSEQETLIDFLASLRRKLFSDDPEPAAVTPPSAPEAQVPSAPAQAGVPAPVDPADGDELLPAQAGAPAEPWLGPPMPPARNAVAARIAERPQPIDEILDESIAQAPLPPGQTAVVARREIPQRVEETPAAPVPAPRPPGSITARVAVPSARPLVPAPPPIKPVVPVHSPSAPAPADDRSAALLQTWQPEAHVRADGTLATRLES